MSVLLACVPIHHCVPGALGGQKKASDPLELEGQIIVSHYVGAENRTWLL